MNKILTLSPKLRDQNTFSRTSLGAGSNALFETRSAVLRWEPWTKSSIFVMLASNSFVADVLVFGWSLEKESTKKAVVMAEKRPIWVTLRKYTLDREGRTNTRVASSPPFHLSMTGSIMSSWDLPRAFQATALRASNWGTARSRGSKYANYKHQFWNEDANWMLTWSIGLSHI